MSWDYEETRELLDAQRRQAEALETIATCLEQLLVRLDTSTVDLGGGPGEPEGPTKCGRCGFRIRGSDRAGDAWVCGACNANHNARGEVIGG